MDFYASTSFRIAIVNLTKKVKDGYASIIKDICDTLLDMPDNILRDTNDRVYQNQDYRIVKLRVPNSGLKLSKANGFRLIYWVSLKRDIIILMSVYPKRGPQAVVDLLPAEYTRLQTEIYTESQAHTLHKVDIKNTLADLCITASISEGR